MNSALTLHVSNSSGLNPCWSVTFKKVKPESITASRFLKVKDLSLDQALSFPTLYLITVSSVTSSQSFMNLCTVKAVPSVAIPLILLYKGSFQFLLEVLPSPSLKDSNLFSSKYSPSSFANQMYSS